MREKTVARVELAAFLLLVIILLAVLTRAQSLPIFGNAVRQAGQSLNGILWPRADVVFLDSANNFYIQRACGIGLQRVAVSNVAGTLIGIDYRPADGRLYGLDDVGVIYTIDNSGVATPFSLLTRAFAGDIRSLFDFNPVADALRLIGANDQNLAVVGAALDTTVAQATIRYAQGDVVVNPNLVGGSYTNNVAGAAQTLFYGIDYVQNSFVTIAQLNAAGSSNTGGGQLRTIGRLTRANKTFNVGASVDFDIYTFDGVNRLIGVNNDTVFTIDLSLITPTSTQDVPVRTLPLGVSGIIDVAVGPQQVCQ